MSARCPDCGQGAGQCRCRMPVHDDGPGPLFAGPVHHAHDPAPAREAGQAITTSGQRQTQAEIVLACVRANPGATAAEIGDRTGLGHVAAQRRLSDLRRADRLRIEGRGTYQGRAMSRWWPTTR